MGRAPELISDLPGAMAPAPALSIQTEIPIHHEILRASALPGGRLSAWLSR